MTETAKRVYYGIGTVLAVVGIVGLDTGLALIGLGLVLITTSGPLK